MLKKKLSIAIIMFLIVLILFVGNVSNAIMVPTRSINLEIENIYRGCFVYAFIPVELVDYNMQKFIENNIENDFLTEKEKAEKVQSYYDKKDYLGYLEYYSELGYDCGDNTAEFRHYCMCLREVEVMDYIEYNGNTYIQMKLKLSDDNKFTFVFKDYLLNYDVRNIVFLIDEYGTKTYIELNQYNYENVPNQASSNAINIKYLYQAQEDAEEIERITNITYAILFCIFVIIIIILIILNIKHDKKIQAEEQARRFWEKPLTKEEKKALKEEKKKQKKEKKKK